jgi:hypothetical protein
MLQVFRSLVTCAPREQPVVRCFAGGGARFPTKDPSADDMRSSAFPLAHELLWTEYARVAGVAAAVALQNTTPNSSSTSVAEALLSPVALCGSVEQPEDAVESSQSGRLSSHEGTRIRSLILNNHPSFEKWMSAMQLQDSGVFSDYYHNVTSYR